MNQSETAGTESFDDLPFDVEKHREGLNAMIRLGLDPRSIKPALRARDLVVIRQPGCKFSICTTALPDQRARVLVNREASTFEVIYQAPDPDEAELVRGEVERYLLRHFPGRTVVPDLEEPGVYVYVTCHE